MPSCLCLQPPSSFQVDSCWWDPSYFPFPPRLTTYGPVGGGDALPPSSLHILLSVTTGHRTYGSPVLAISKMKPFSDTFLRPISPGCVGQCPSLPCRHPAACSSLHPPRAQRLQDSSWQSALPSASGRTEPSSSSFSSSSPCAGPPRQDFPLGSPAERRCGRR